MSTISNEFNIGRTAKAQFTLGNAATTLSSGVFIPTGAIVTGVRMMPEDATTTTGAAATVQLAISNENIVATTTVSDLPAQTVPEVIALATTDGNYIDVDSEILLVEQASSTSAATGTYDVYVDYIYA